MLRHLVSLRLYVSDNEVDLHYLLYYFASFIVDLKAVAEYIIRTKTLPAQEFEHCSFKIGAPIEHCST